jgi:hypothetical protein
MHPTVETIRVFFVEWVEMLWIKEPSCPIERLLPGREIGPVVVCPGAFQVAN